jgi:hypothetical protein
MFHRVTFFVDDRKVGTALRALVGIALDQPKVEPVTNVEEVPNGKAKKLVAQSDGSAVGQFIEHVRRKHLTVVDAPVCRAFLASVGLSASSASYVLRQATKMGALKKVGQGTATKYPVVTTKK